jgi:hypothetical protein
MLAASSTPVGPVVNSCCSTARALNADLQMNIICKYTVYKFKLIKKKQKVTKRDDEGGINSLDRVVSRQNHLISNPC